MRYCKAPSAFRRPAAQTLADSPAPADVDRVFRALFQSYNRTTCEAFTALPTDSQVYAVRRALFPPGTPIDDLEKAYPLKDENAETTRKVLAPLIRAIVDVCLAAQPGYVPEKDVTDYALLKPTPFFPFEDPSYAKQIEVPVDPSIYAKWPFAVPAPAPAPVPNTSFGGWSGYGFDQGSWFPEVDASKYQNVAAGVVRPAGQVMGDSGLVVKLLVLAATAYVGYSIGQSRGR